MALHNRVTRGATYLCWQRQRELSVAISAARIIIATSATSRYRAGNSAFSTLSRQSSRGARS